MPLVRTTINPSVEIFVSDAEYLDLSRQRLIFGGEPPVVAPLAIKSRIVEDAARPGSFTLSLENESEV